MHETNSAVVNNQSSIGRPTAIRFIILIGIVSLFADMTYEGARSITGLYLGVLGASATVVGIVAGFGELIGYGIRLVSGWLGDRTQRSSMTNPSWPSRCCRSCCSCSLAIMKQSGRPG
jgi:hypothetical protein